MSNPWFNDDQAAQCCHVWESGEWGIIIGVSKCKLCGKVSHSADFPDLPKEAKP